MKPYDPDALDRRDPRLIARVQPAMSLFARSYCSLETEGTRHLPSGPALLVANHNGGIVGPDLMCTLSVLWRHLAETPLYALAHDFVMRQCTLLGRLIQPFGALSARRGNAMAALSLGGKVLVYPGGDLEAYRSFGRRNEVVILPRTGFVNVARAARVPIVPIVTQGAHRNAVIFHEGRRIARWLRLRRWARLERFPVALALPWGVAVGPWLPYLPLPFPIRMKILAPMWPGADESSHTVAVRVEAAMQRALDGLVWS